MQADSLGKERFSDTCLAYEQNGSSFVQPLQAVKILDLRLGDGATGRKVDILERGSHGKLGALDPMTGVIRRLVGEAPVLNAKHLDFARHHAFRIAPCNVRAGNEKGRVESGVDYVKKNFLNGLQFLDFSAVNPDAQIWLTEIANMRVHGETHRKPIELFEEERAHLRAPNAQPYDLARVLSLRASSQFRVAFEANRYSVPAEQAGWRLTSKPIRIGDAFITRIGSSPAISAASPVTRTLRCQRAPNNPQL
jgi:hypothetical protein